MKKLLSSAIISIIIFPSVLTNLAIAQGNSDNKRSTSQTLLAQADPAKQVEQLFEAAKKLTAEKKYQQAEQKYQQILSIVSEATSPDNPELAQIHFSLGILDHKQQNYSAAKADYKNAVQVNLQYVSAINNLGLIAYEEGEVDKAIEYWQSAIEINNDNSAMEAKLSLAVAFYQHGKQEKGIELAKQTFGDNIKYSELSILEDNLWGTRLRQDTEILLIEKQIQTYVVELERASELNQQAIKFAQQGRYSEAEPLYKKALAIRKRIFPNNHPDVAQSLNNLSQLYSLQGKYSEAEPLYKKALVIRKRIFPNNHPDVAQSLNNLSQLYSLQGKYSEAEPLCKEALAIRKRIFPDDHPDVAQSLNHLAVLHYFQGRYSEAESLYSEVLMILKHVLPADHPSIASSLHNLAKLYQVQGRYSEAETLHKESLAMERRLYSGDHPDLAISINDLAKLYQVQGRYSEAETLYKEALTMKKQLLPDDHPSLATSINDLATLYKLQGRYSEAESLFQQALVINKRLFHKDNYFVAVGIHNLATLYQSQERYSEAETLYKEALTMYKRILPQNHPHIATNLMNIGVFYQSQAQHIEALNYIFQASEVQENILSKNLIIGSEQQKKQFLDLFQGYTDLIISFHLTADLQNRQAAELALTTILRRKGRVLDSMSQTLQTLRDNLGSESEELFSELADSQTQLATLSSRPLPNDATRRQDIQAQQAEINKKIKKLEVQLSSLSKEFRQETTPVTIEQVQQAIPNNAVLVEFIQYRPFSPKANSNKYGEPSYAAYVLLPNGQMRWQDLGEVSVIDDKIKSLRALLGNGGERGLGAIQAESGTEATKEVARELDELLMQPVRGMVGDATHLLLSPDSQLNTLPFAALVDEQDKYLVENYLITYLTSGRDLLRLQLNQNQDTSEPLLMANPTYSSPGVAIAADNKADRESDTRGRRSGELATLEPFQSLPGTKVEGEAIAQLVPNLKVLTEQRASENNLKQTKNPEFLHLATHGFFLPPQPEEPNKDRNNGTLSLDNQTPVFSTAENPLLRSGLALAGFNQRDSGTEDGVLTALEVTGLNLRGTKLVVMSACETGLGDVQAGEGVYGLRRAFTLAGAQSQLMSLWSVDDDSTKDLMVDYYTRIQNGEARGEALRQVQLEMLNSEDRNHPFFWAAFIPSGSWLPLDSVN